MVLPRVSTWHELGSADGATSSSSRPAAPAVVFARKDPLTGRSRYIRETCKTLAEEEAAAEGGGARGIAMLAGFIDGEPRRSLPRFPSAHVFANTDLETADADPGDVGGLETFIQCYVAALPSTE